VRTAGTAKEKVTQGNLLQILTAGGDVEDEDDIDDCDPWAAPTAAGETIRRRVLIQPRGKILL
jgi:hypothetical protein